MNSVVISGRLTKDVDLRSTGEVDIANFTVAVDRQIKVDGEWKKDADFINCTAFGAKANFVNKYFGKGSGILVKGNIKTGNYTNKDGVKVYTTVVQADDIEFFGSKEEKKEEPKKNDGFMDIPDGVNDEGLPFN